MGHHRVSDEVHEQSAGGAAEGHGGLRAESREKGAGVDEAPAHDVAKLLVSAKEFVKQLGPSMPDLRGVLDTFTRSLGKLQDDQVQSGFLKWRARSQRRSRGSPPRRTSTTILPSVGQPDREVDLLGSGCGPF